MRGTRNSARLRKSSDGGGPDGGSGGQAPTTTTPPAAPSPAPVVEEKAEDSSTVSLVSDLILKLPHKQVYPHCTNVRSNVVASAELAKLA